MARSAEVVRQWQILQAIDAARNGVTIQALAKSTGASTRTIRRDLDALERAGFPLYNDRINGTTHWKLNTKPFRTLSETGFGFTQLCALYFSRSLVDTLTGTPFAAELKRAFGKLEAALPTRTKRYLDRLPELLRAKAGPRKRQNDRRAPERIARLVDASFQHRRVAMRYHSLSSRRVKNYIVNPHRLVYAFGGIYLSAWVEEYGEMRTFATERIQSVSMLSEHFTPRPDAGDPFRHSLGVHSGSPVHVEIEFDARIADYIREQEWHASQQLLDQVDGTLRVTLEVSADYALRSWILSFGPLARIASPSWLAQQILEDLNETRENYAPRMDFELAVVILDELDAQSTLPFPTPH